MNKIQLNRYLRALVGSQELVEAWWVSPNKHWDLKTPQEVFDSGPEGQKEVENYILVFCYGDGS